MTATVLSSLNASLAYALAKDERVLLMGEDILDPYGGAFKVTQGLSSQYPGRVLNTPISEAGLAGVAAGMALRGLRPVLEVMFGDFLTLTADMLTNTISKYPWMYADQVHLPLVIRTPMGGRRGYGPTHSQSLEKQFLGLPGLRVLAPVNLDSLGRPGDTPPLGGPGELLAWVILEQEMPCVFIENKVQYLEPLLTPAGLSEFEVQIAGQGAPSVTFSLKSAPAPSVTLVAYGEMASLARQAMLNLAYDHEVFTQLVVPTQLAPFEIDAILESVQKTHRLVTCEEGTLSLGWGAEIIARASIALGSDLKAARRLAARDQPVPASRALEEGALPGLSDMIQLVLSIESHA